MIEFRHPLRIKAGDEITFLGLDVGELRERIRVTYHWGFDQINVLGANMIRPNVFEFGPQTKGAWYVKYAVSQDTKPCQKSLYINVERIKTNKPLIWFLRVAAILLFIIPVAITLWQVYMQSKQGPSFNIGISAGSLTFALPLTFILTILLWSRKVTEYITRLFEITSSSKDVELEYLAKGMSKYSIEIISQDSNRNNRNSENNIQNSMSNEDLSSWIRIKPIWTTSELTR